MITQTQLSVRTVNPKDRHKLANLIHFETYVHRHLDWRPPLDWLGNQPYLLAEQNGSVIGALACPPDPPQVSWIRLFAAASYLPVDRAWHALWPAALDDLQQADQLGWVAAIPLQEWFQSLLEKSQFVLTHRVIMLSWEPSRMPVDAPHSAGLTLRPMNFDDLPAVREVDAASFTPIWQNSIPCLQLAFNQATIATVAEQEGRMVGYQISTATSLGGHLARLAVLPEHQGKGIGFSLVCDLLKQFERRGAAGVTVNTQQDNEASLSLYRKAGFRRTGEEYPVYEYALR